MSIGINIGTTLGRGNGGARGPLAYTEKVKAIAPANHLACYPLAESSGTVITDESGNARHGTYTGVTLGNTGIGDGRTAAGFDGAISKGNIHGASLAAAFSGAAGTIAAWARVSAAGIWTDATNRNIVRIQVDASNYLILMRATVNNQLDMRYNAAGTLEILTPTVGPTTAWFHVAMTWDKAAEQVKFFVNGAQSGATATALGIFAGVPAATTTVIGAQNTTPAQVWSGNVAHVNLWNIALNAAQIASAAVTI